MSFYQTRKTLIQRIRDLYDDRSWEEFVYYYERYVYVIIRNMNLSHHDAEDLTQQVMMKVWKSIQTFEYAPGKHRFRSWLCAVTRNTVLHFLQLKSTRMAHLSENERNELAIYLEMVTVPEVETIAEEEWEHYIANLALENVKKRFQPQVVRAFELFMKGKTGEEVANELGIPLNTAHVYKQRVKNAMCKEILRLDRDLD